MVSLQNQPPPPIPQISQVSGERHHRPALAAATAAADAAAAAWNLTLGVFIPLSIISPKSYVIVSRYTCTYHHMISNIRNKYAITF